MPFIPTPQTLQVEFVHLFNGQYVEWVLHYTGSAAPDTTNMTAFAAACVTWWNANIRSRMTAAVQLIQVKVTDMSSATGEVVTYGTGLPSTGTAVGDSLPNNVALVISKRTNKRGRSFRGRIYMFGWPEAENAGNTVSPTTTNAYLTAWGLLKTLVVGSDSWGMVVLSRYNAGVPRPFGVPTLVTNFTTDGSVDSQRRRLPGRGA